jgi:hypothetical protein
MKLRYRLFQRVSGIFFIEDCISKKQESLKTRDKTAAQRIFNARNEAHQQPAINLQIARAYLMASDPAVATRTGYCLAARLSARVSKSRECSPEKRSHSRGFCRLRARWHQSMESSRNTWQRSSRFPDVGSVVAAQHPSAQRSVRGGAKRIADPLTGWLSDRRCVSTNGKSTRRSPRGESN